MSLLVVCALAFATEPIVLFFDATDRPFPEQPVETAGLGQRLPSPSPWVEEDAGVADRVALHKDCAHLRESWMTGSTFGTDFVMIPSEYFVIQVYSGFVRQARELRQEIFKAWRSQASSPGSLDAWSLESAERLLKDFLWDELLHSCQHVEPLIVRTNGDDVRMNGADPLSRLCIQTLRTLWRRIAHAPDRVVAIKLLIQLLDGPLRPLGVNDAPFKDLEETSDNVLLMPDRSYEVMTTAPERVDLDGPRPYLVKKWIRAVEECAPTSRGVPLWVLPSRVSLAMALRLADDDDLVAVAQGEEDDVATCIRAAVASYPRGDVASPNGTRMMHTTGLLQHLESPSLLPPEDCLGEASENERDLAINVALFIDTESRECVNQQKLLAAALDVLRYRVKDEWSLAENACTVRGLMHRVQRWTRELGVEARCRVEAHVAHVISKTALRHVPRVDRRSYGAVRCKPRLLASAAQLILVLLGSICLLWVAVALRLSRDPQEEVSAKPTMRKLNFRHKRMPLASPATV